MWLLDALQENSFDIEYNPGANNYIQDVLSRRSDLKTPPIPRVTSTSLSLRKLLLMPAPPASLNSTPNMNHPTYSTPSCTAIGDAERTPSCTVISTETFIEVASRLSTWSSYLRAASSATSGWRGCAGSTRHAHTLRGY